MRRRWFDVSEPRPEGVIFAPPRAFFYREEPFFVRRRNGELVVVDNIGVTVRNRTRGKVIQKYFEVLKSGEMEKGVIDE